MKLLKQYRLLRLSSYLTKQLRPVAQLGDPGSGAGKGGGAGGSIRNAGGVFGKVQAAREEQYFRKQQKEQLWRLREAIKDDIFFHQEEIKKHQEVIDRYKQRMDKFFK
ncbi:hypothetical protein [Enterobacter cloacae complex sp. 2DZ2F20B]|uniref:ATP synthase F1 subunit epsilon n=1 Tax=Zophobas morio TaxID=2755281 RepID=A0AA38MLB1_9CUCU|nr:hypothetical protein [Enterobacter cloacae complex sp. 2DZ2F20B]KAJ3660651.1 hypothetical protein Zmor_005090 [Zophobas morio]RYA67258.1 hypothetical protein DD592_27665 [Enterobacter cloacae complex sp. 2DZ2F20B]